MTPNFHFTFENLRHQLIAALDHGYQFLTCEEYVHRKAEGGLPDRTLINRVDVDFSCKKARRLAETFNNLGVKATFFVRLHAPEYNLFSFENYRCMKFIRDSHHEIGYHSEIIDEAAIWGEDPAECLRRDLDTLNGILGIQVKGVASHGGMTGLNNLDFWQNNKPCDFNLSYEAYEWFNDVFYISDSEWYRWKCYNKGRLRKGDQRSPVEHLMDYHPIIYLLTHPDTYFDKHFYE